MIPRTMHNGFFRLAAPKSSMTTPKTKGGLRFSGLPSPQVKLRTDKIKDITVDKQTVQFIYFSRAVIGLKFIKKIILGPVELII